MELIEATVSINGNVLLYLSNVDENYATMDSTTNITLKFKNSFGEVPSGFLRDYVLITNERYENVNDDNLSGNGNQNQNNIPVEYKLFRLSQSF